MNNFAFIDGQNLHLGTKADGWVLDLARFRIYLREKYNVTIAYYFLGCVSDANEELYDTVQKAGFILKFREHNPAMIGTKKGNVDTDLIFEMMKSLIEEDSMSAGLLVSGDGDYKKVVDYCIKKERFAKILFPNKRYSSLYKSLGNNWTVRLDALETRSKIEKRANEKGA